MKPFDLLEFLSKAQVATALSAIAFFLAIIALKLTSSKK
ncbi:MAG: hypothetical protein UY21_C0002G0008 [Microgenomates group bacterium GW2011_GWA1_48_10]|nr:MAG: hypothetical protein UY21_C0002G0008 [Microgenomates group bacterium GW2011_GWA1_48_10]